MTDANRIRFEKRVRSIETQHARMGSGYVRMVERNGILVPTSPVRTRRAVPLRGLVLALGVFLVFKALLFVHLGPITYVDRVSKLESGNVVEQVGAWAMRADPVTLWISDQLAQVL